MAPDPTIPIRTSSCICPSRRLAIRGETGLLLLATRSAPRRRDLRDEPAIRSDSNTQGFPGGYWGRLGRQVIRVAIRFGRIPPDPGRIPGALEEAERNRDFLCGPSGESTDVPHFTLPPRDDQQAADPRLDHSRFIPPGRHVAQEIESGLALVGGG